MNRRTLLLIVLVLAVLVAACGGGDDGADDAATTAASDTTAAAETTEAPAETSSPSETTVPETPPETTEAEESTTTAAAGTAVEVEEFRAALAATTAAESGLIEGSFVIAGVQGLPGTSSLETTFTGAFDNAEGLFSFTMDLGGMLESTGETLPPEMAGLFSEMEILTVGDTAYMRFPLFSILGVETEWVSLPADEAGTAAGGFAGATPGNPVELLEAFERADAQITELGRETVRGVETTHYRVVFDTQKLLEQADPEQIEALQQQSPLPTDELPIEYWIGDDGLVYRYVIDIDGSKIDATGAEGFDRMTMTFEIFDYGTEVSFEVPSADEVTPFSELEGRLPPQGGGLGSG